jgi:hypothetical protein
MSKLETNTIDTISGSTTLTLGGTNATTIAQDSATTVTGFKSTGIDDNATANALTIDSSSNLQFNSGYGSVATAYGCRAWVKFDGTGTLAVNGSGNVSSVTDNGTGIYVVNFSTSLPTHYQISAGHKRVGASAEIVNIYGFNTGSINIDFFAGGSLSDTDYIGIAVHR